MAEILRDKHGNKQHRITCPTCGTEAVVLAKATYCSVACSKIGKKRPAISGSNHYRWAGDSPSYTATHHRVNRERGKAPHCESCGTDDPAQQYEWAFNNTGDPANINNYSPMCRKCHWAFDSELHPRGSRNGLAKLTEDIVRTCRARNAAGETCADLAHVYGVSKHTMWAAVTGRTWRHVA